MLESELSFLVTALPDLAGARSKKISQHYLSDGADPLRLRAAAGDGGAYFELTKKLSVSPNDLTRKEEINVPLTPEEYASLLPLARRGLEKTRYTLPLDGGLTAELDVYSGPLEGFMKVEVEFPDEATRTAFMPPSWFGRDVSQEAWAKNAALAGKSFEDIRSHVE